MPYVSIKITDGKVSSEDRKALIEGAARLPQAVRGKNPTTMVVTDEVSTDNWSSVGEQVTLRRQREQ